MCAFFFHKCTCQLFYSFSSSKAIEMEKKNWNTISFAISFLQLQFISISKWNSWTDTHEVFPGFIHFIKKKNNCSVCATIHHHPRKSKEKKRRKCFLWLEDWPTLLIRCTKQSNKKSFQCNSSKAKHKKQKLLTK